MNLEAKVLVGDAREKLATLPERSVQTVVTSPPYWGLRDYGHDGQIGLEQTPDEFIEQLCQVFDEVWRVLKDYGTIWVNLGDSYSAMRDSKAVPDTLRNGDGTRVEGAANRNPANLRKAGLKHKDLVGIPWRFAFAMQARGWYLRQDIIWAKPNPMPESVADRCTKSHEYIFLMSKNPKYYYDNESIKEDALTEPTVRDKNAEGYQADYAKGDRFSEGARVYGADGKRNKRDVWTVNVKPYKEAHFATYPPELVKPCILAGTKEGDIVLDPFSGSGTTGEVALQHNRNYIGLELNPQYANLSEKRLTNAIGMFGQVEIL
jgi:DNA modification methylase